MSDLGRVLRLLAIVAVAGVARRWPAQTAGVVIGAVAWTAVGPWAGWLLLGAGVVAPRAWRMHRREAAERVEVDR